MGGRELFNWSLARYCHALDADAVHAYIKSLCMVFRLPFWYGVWCDMWCVGVWCAMSYDIFGVDAYYNTSKLYVIDIRVPYSRVGGQEVRLA
jgi:hypothetical protein